MCGSRHAHARRACGCAPSHPSHASFAHHHYPGDPAARSLGVRRPLRFLAWRLGLSEEQVTELAATLNDLKTERAQSDVDDRRAIALFAEAAEGETFDRAKADEAAALRAGSAERLQKKVVESLARMHAQLTAEQRGRLAYLLRTGTLVM